MTLPKFAFGMLIVVAIVTTWSLIDDASWATIALRAVVCAVILQVGYFLAVVFMIDRKARKPARETGSLPVKSPTSPPKVSGEQNLSS